MELQFVTPELQDAYERRDYRAFLAAAKAVTYPDMVLDATEPEIMAYKCRGTRYVMVCVPPTIESWEEGTHDGLRDGRFSRLNTRGSGRFVFLAEYLVKNPEVIE